MTVEGLSLNTVFTTPPLRPRDYHRTGSKKNVRAKIQGKGLQNAVPRGQQPLLQSRSYSSHGSLHKTSYHQAELIIDPGGNYGPCPSFLGCCLLMDSRGGAVIFFSCIFVVTSPPGSNGYFQTPGFTDTLGKLSGAPNRTHGYECGKGLVGGGGVGVIRKQYMYEIVRGQI